MQGQTSLENRTYGFPVSGFHERAFAIGWHSRTGPLLDRPLTALVIDTGSRNAHHAVCRGAARIASAPMRDFVKKKFSKNRRAKDQKALSNTPLIRSSASIRRAILMNGREGTGRRRLDVASVGRADQLAFPYHASNLIFKFAISLRQFARDHINSRRSVIANLTASKSEPGHGPHISVISPRRSQRRSRWSMVRSSD